MKDGRKKTRWWKSALTFLLAAFMCLSLFEGTAVTANAAKKKAPTSVKLSQTKLTLTVGKTKQLTCKIKPANANKKVTWSSNKPSVATVSSKGLVKGIKAGTATITVKAVANKKKAKCKVTVKNAAPQTISATIRFRNRTGRQIDKLYFKYSSAVDYGDEYLATRDFRFWSDNRFMDVPLKFKTNDSLDFYIRYNDGTEYEAKGLSLSKATAQNTSIELTSSEVVLSVNDEKMTSVPFEKQSTAPVETPSVTGVKLDQTSLTLEVGATKQLTGTVSPAGANDKVTWKTSNSSVATVSADGVVKGVKAGTATITVTTVDGGKTATCKVTVKAATPENTGISDADWAALQKNYAALEDAYNAVAKLYNSDQIKANKDIETLMAQAKSLIEQMGKIKREDVSASQGRELNGAMKDIADALLKIIESMETEPAPGSAGISDADWYKLVEKSNTLYNAYMLLENYCNDGIIKTDKEIEALLAQVKSLLEELAKVNRADLTASKGQELTSAVDDMIKALFDVINSMEDN